MLFFGVHSLCECLMVLLFNDGLQQTKTHAAPTELRAFTNISLQTCHPYGVK